MTAVHSVAEFETWRPGYGGAIVTVLVAGTTTPADLYSDEALTVAVANPQTLESYTDLLGTIYGKFNVPVYTASPYTLDIDSTDQTGIERPALTTLVGEAAGQSTVTVSGSTQANDLRDIVARNVDVRNYGTLSDTDSATNTTILTTAIGVVAGRGGGFVFIPAGTWPFTQLTVPVNVVLVGAGRGVTVLQSQTGDIVCTLGGDRAGFMALTLDGVDLQVGSTGVYSKANDETVFANVDVKRFETGIHYRGGRRAEWREFYVSTCDTGAKLHGDSDATGGADGDDFRANSWAGGKVELCNVIGIDLSYEDLPCVHNSISVDFEGNLAIGLNINGAQFSEFPNCNFSLNTTNVSIDDDSDVIDGNPNHVLSARFLGGSMDGGQVVLVGDCRDIVLERFAFTDVDFILTLPLNPILLLDCTEDADVTVAGDGTKLVRRRSVLDGAASGLTTSDVATKAWGLELLPGQIAILEAWVLGNRRDGITLAHYIKQAKVSRPGSALDYESQTANYVVGEVLTGATSGASARITADSDSGTTGTLTLRDIVGEFQDGEIITGSGGGSATANGTLVHQDVAIDQADTIGTDHEDVAGWNALWAANNSEIELRVLGAADTTIEWTVNVRALLS